MNKVIEQFAKRAETYSASANWISDSALIQAHIDATGRKPPGTVLELCCGTGMVGRNFAAAGWHVCGVDLTQQMAEEANRFYPCICSPVENIPFLDNSFDVVVLRQAYFLLEDGQKALSEAHRVLKHDGVLVFSQTVPYSGEDSPWLEHIHRFKQAQMKQFYTTESLARELEHDYFNIQKTARLSVRENVTRWMTFAPELSAEKQKEVCDLVANAPEPYHSMHRVEVVDGDVYEDWSWVIFTATRKPER